MHGVERRQRPIYENTALRSKHEVEHAECFGSDVTKLPWGAIQKTSPSPTYISLLYRDSVGRQKAPVCSTETIMHCCVQLRCGRRSVGLQRRFSLPYRPILLFRAKIHICSRCHLHGGAEPHSDRLEAAHWSSCRMDTACQMRSAERSAGWVRWLVRTKCSQRAVLRLLRLSPAECRRMRDRCTKPYESYSKHDIRQW